MARYYFTTTEDDYGYPVLDRVTVDSEKFKDEPLVFFEDTDILEISQCKLINLEYPIYNGKILKVIDNEDIEHIISCENIHDEYTYYDLFEELGESELKIKKAEYIRYDKENPILYDITEDTIKLYKEYLSN